MVAAISAFDHEPPLSLYRREKEGTELVAPSRFQPRGAEEGSQFRFCVPLSSYYSIQPQRPPLLFPPKELRATK